MKNIHDTLQKELATTNVAVVIPCYKVKKHILGVLAAIKTPVKRIYCVDDACPDGSGKFITKHVKDKRVKVLYNKKNLGAGGGPRRPDTGQPLKTTWILLSKLMGMARWTLP